VSIEALFRDVFPGDVAVAWGEIGDATAELHPDEAPLVARAVDKRQREFARGRSCARRALAGLGFERVSVLVGEAREPLWPEGVVGSITHDNTLCVVAVARAHRYSGLGVDVEPEGALAPEVAARIWSPAEAERAEGVAALTAGSAARLVFSAKEAFYKCQYPLTRTYLGFHDVEVELGAGTFVLTLRTGAGPLASGARFDGVWRRAGGEILTAVVLGR
jgi:4'-phosphopantetheinyl transferase EntD